MNFGNDEGGKIDPITRARMEQAGLHVPDGLTKEKRLWHRALNRETRCRECRQELTVRCPTDGTLRSASEQTCSACGTRYVLGAVETAVAVQRRSGPPAGGAAVA